MSEEVLENVFLGVKDDQILVSSMNEDNRRINENNLKNTFFQDGEFYNINKMVLIHNPWTYNFQHFIDETLPICIECKDDPEVYVSVWPKFGDDIINFLKTDTHNQQKNKTNIKHIKLKDYFNVIKQTTAENPLIIAPVEIAIILIKS